MNIPNEAKQGLEDFAKVFENVQRVAGATHGKVLKDIKTMVINNDEEGLKSLIKTLQNEAKK